MIKRRGNKPHRTVSFSVELDSILGILASSSQQNLSEFLEIRLREHPEIRKTIERIRSTPEPQSMLEGNLPQTIHSEPEELAAR